MDNQQLPNQYTLWIAQILENHIMDANEYENNLTQISDFSSWDQFWEIYQHLQRPSSIPVNCELFFFKKGIKPVWEENENRGGGKFILRIKKDHADKAWERLLISFLGQSFDLIVGIVVISKQAESIISLWTKELELYGHKLKIKQWIRDQLQIDEKVYIEYKEHPYTNELGPLTSDLDTIFQGVKLKMSKEVS